jgi:alkylhydroperoxidase family enzyme
MAWIRVVPVGEAKGLLGRHYRAAISRAGRLWNIVAVMGVNPRALGASMRFYSVLMHGRSPLDRARREMLATVVSTANHCRY